MQAEFEALIKQIQIKSLVSLDKEAEIRLRFLPNDELMDKLTRLHRADSNVKVIIKDNEISK